MKKFLFVPFLLFSSYAIAQTMNATNKLIEIRSYNLKPGTRDQFHKIMTEVSLPLLKAVNMEVVSHGPSSHDEDSYFLIRLFDDLADRQQQEDAFYGSIQWIKGPREKVLSFIETYTTITIPADEHLIQSLKSIQ